MNKQNGYRIMVVEDDSKIADILRDELERYGHTVVMVKDFARVKEDFVANKPDLALMDINLPRYDGYYWCRQIRSISKVPIIFISAREDDVDQVRALENGGDDYITKPFHLELTVAKINSLLRRTYGEYALQKEPDILRLGNLLINRSDNTISFNDALVELTAKEFDLLWLLAQGPGQIIGRDELLEVLWDDTEFVDDNTLTVNVTRLRRRLAEIGLQQAIETKRGLGYRLVLPEV